MSIFIQKRLRASQRPAVRSVAASLGHKHLRQMPAERIYLLQFRVGFLEHSKLDVAVSSLEAQLIRAFEGHGIERYEKFTLGRPDCSEKQNFLVAGSISTAFSVAV
jgi:hypothetical protein